MLLMNINNTQDVVEMKEIPVNGKMVDLSKLTDDELYKLNYVKVKRSEVPNALLYTYSKEYLYDPELKEAKIVYNKKQREINEIRENLKSVLGTVFNKLLERPPVKSKYGFVVDGGEKDLQNLKMGYDHNLSYVIDGHGIKRNVTKEEFKEIIREVEEKRLKLMQNKWNYKEKIGNAENIEEFEQILNQVMEL